MQRRNFLKKFTFLIPAAVIVPTILAQSPQWITFICGFDRDREIDVMYGLDSWWEISESTGIRSFTVKNCEGTWNRLLTPEEIAWLDNYGRGRFYSELR